MNTPSPCSRCRRPVPAGEAAVSLRALSAVLCYRCRNVDSPDLEAEAVSEDASPAEQVAAANRRQWRAIALEPIGSKSGAGPVERLLGPIV